MKEIKIRPRIESHDLLVKINNIRRLVPRHDVRVTVIFRGREMLYINDGEKILDKIVESTQDLAKVISRGRKDNTCVMVLRS